MPELPDLLDEVASSASRLPKSRESVRELTDQQLMEAQRTLALIERQANASSALVASEISYRSRPDLGYDGLAQRTGARTPESLVQQLTGSTGREAATLVRVGKVMAEAESLSPVVDPGGAAGGDPAPDGTPPAGPAAETQWDGTSAVWLAPVGRAVADGSLPVTAADAIRAGLGVPSETVTVSQLTLAAQGLVAEAARLNADQLAKRARAVRDEIDSAGVAERERQRHEQRYLRVFKRGDGMIRVDGLLAPESGGADVLATFEAVTSPRRGGPRFVDKAEQERAKRLLEDPRTTEQIVADALVKLIELGADDLRESVEHGDRAGIGWLEGHSHAVSMGTVARNVCTTGTIPILFDDDGQCLNVGRDHRLFTAKQRIALAARDGGCRFPGCDRPPSWCEAHHIDPHCDGGRTDVADGILLCRHHHMLIHNNHWRIRRDGADYFLLPPKERDPHQIPIPMPTKSLALAHLHRRRRAG